MKHIDKHGADAAQHFKKGFPNQKPDKMYEYYRWGFIAGLNANIDCECDQAQSCNKCNDFWFFQKSSVPNIREVPPTPEKKAELIPLSKIAKLCKLGKHEIHSKTCGPLLVVNGSFYERVEGDTPLKKVDITCDYFTDDWQIIPSAPKVLSAEEMFEKINKVERDAFDWVDKDIHYAIKESHKNARLECQPVIDSAKELIVCLQMNFMDGDREKLVLNLVEALKNIDPSKNNTE